MGTGFRILQGDVLDRLRTLPDESVHCVVTSPPYWRLRDYGVSGQLGLEPTPAEYISKMVAVFQEVRRVLRKDGTCWVNIGDSYCSQGGIHDGREDNQPGVGANKVWRNGSGRADGIVDERGQRNRNGNTVSGLKPKDLVGIPWRLAFALQQPYYTGNIKDEGDRIWLAAMLDAEGCMFIHRRKAGQANGQGYFRQNDTFGPGVEIANTSQAVIDRIMKLAGKGSICSQGPEQTGGRRKQTLYRWNLRTIESVDFVRELYPYLVAKQHQARLLCACPSSGEDARKAHLGLIELHRGRKSDIDFRPPASMYAQGWWLRQDIIWSKLNPMPESVTDRCTKAHEYIFLLSKSERYHYDADAIKEPCIAGDNGSSYTSDYDRQTKPGLGHGSRKPRTAGNKAHKFVTEYEQSETEEHRTKAGLLKISDEIYDTRNKRSVWTVPSQAYPEAHFATFPEELIVPCILAGCPAGGTVLDPFSGSGTTGVVALRYHREYIGIELNPEYAALSEQRITGDAPLFNSGSVFDFGEVR